MYCESCDEPLEVQSVVRKQNRILRRIVGNLRRTVQKSGAVADQLFISLCETDPAAELAMRELWESGEFTCGPQDYDEIVKHCIAAMKATSHLRRDDFEQTAQAGCQLPPEGWRCTRARGHSGPCAALPIIY